MARHVLASANPGKVAEINRMLAGTGIEVVPVSGFGDFDPEETGGTFVENAIIKAREAARLSGLPAIADDSGLEVDALGGAPGVRSARYAGGGGDAANNRLLLQRLVAVPPDRRAARFRCIVVRMRNPDDPAPLICEGVWEGRIGTTPRGRGGFGYDPLFLPADSDRTAAELEPEEKNRLSHRARAVAGLVAALAGRP